MEKSGSYSERPNGVPDLGRLLRTLETKDQALKAAELAKLLCVTRQHIYKMAAEGTIPSFRVGCAIRFDPGRSRIGSVGGCPLVRSFAKKRL